MRSNLELDFGKLVRVKTLSIGIAYFPYQNLNEWNKETCFQRYRSNAYCLSELSQKLQIPEKDIFKDFNLGNVITDPEHSYIGKITSYILVRNGHYVFLDTQKKIKDFCKMNRKKKYYPLRIGIEFYPGFKKTADGSYIEIGSRFFDNSPVKLMFYYKDLISIEKLVQFESVQVGNLAVQKRAKGIVISISKDSELDFHLKNSWTVKKVMMLGNSKDAYKHTRLLPDKNYKVF